MEDTMRGSTKDCLRHYAKSLPSAKRMVAEARAPLVGFTKACYTTIYNWTADSPKGFPIGLNLIKVRLFLLELGYAVIEMENLKSFQLQTALLLGYDILTSKELALTIGLKVVGNRGHERTLAIALGRAGASKRSRATLERLGEQHRQTINQRKAALHAELSAQRRAVAKLGIPVSDLPDRPPLVPVLRESASVEESHHRSGQEREFIELVAKLAPLGVDLRGMNGSLNRDGLYREIGKAVVRQLGETLVALGS